MKQIKMAFFDSIKSIYPVVFLTGFLLIFTLLIVFFGKLAGQDIVSIKGFVDVYLTFSIGSLFIAFVYIVFSKTIFSFETPKDIKIKELQDELNKLKGAYD